MIGPQDGVFLVKSPTYGGQHLGNAFQLGPYIGNIGLVVQTAVHEGYQVACVVWPKCTEWVDIDCLSYYSPQAPTDEEMREVYESLGVEGTDT